MPISSLADIEKQQVARNSVFAAFFLTGSKLLVGFLTGSLGILAEAAHSGLDMVAALMTYLAVRISSRPADREHQYGHGKVENLSALFETLLLLLTCVWIIYEAVHRLFFKPVEVEVTFWSFAVMAVSIGVDVSRSRMLYRAARKHHSQALEADALHFSTDIWSSTVVIIGLGGVKLWGFFPQFGFLKQLDAIAALVVALIVVGVSIRLGKRTIAELLDTAPAGMEEEIIKLVESIPEVLNCHNVRIRASGPQYFIDIHVLMDGNTTLAAAHLLTERIEQQLQETYHTADILVHPEPAPFEVSEAGGN
jgi:cation diffusion facilitator family transporter